jgi:hypothetical protein
MLTKINGFSLALQGWMNQNDKNQKPGGTLFLHRIKKQTKPQKHNPKQQLN